MARQPYSVNTSDKQMEVFSSFDGGMNTQEHPSKLNDNEFTLMQNVNIVAGGIVTNREAYARTKVLGSLNLGVSQGLFYYDNLNNSTIIHAIGGKLYKLNEQTGATTLLPITDLASGFQTTRPVEAVQYRTLLYIATGSGLVKFDGTTASLVQAYKPTGLEALYIGTNGYAADPDNFLADITAGASNNILGIKSDQRYGVVNKSVTFTAYSEKIASDTLQYKFSSKYVTEPKFTQWADWGLTKTMSHKFGKNTDYQIKCEIRKNGTTVTLDEYIIPKFRVASTPDAKPEATINFEDMKLCNRILLHYDRLVLYGDTNNPDHMYTSHLNNFAYFPRTNIMRISDPTRGSLNSVIQYKNFLVCFTTNSIQMITGVAPSEYAKIPIHTTIGTKHPYSVQVMKNYIVFVSRDNSVYILKSFNYSTTDKLNVERIDLEIKDALTTDLNGVSKKVIGMIHNDQYYLYVQTGTNCHIYRFYYELGVWVRDYVANNYSTMKSINGSLYLTPDETGQLHKLTKDVFMDDLKTRFTMTIASKDYDYGLPYHKKKLKQFQLISKVQSDTSIVVVLTADSTTNLLISPVTVDPTKNGTDSQKFILPVNGRFRYIKSIIKAEVKSNVQLLSFGFVFKYSSPK
jgi:hypothetical protein